MQTPYHPTDQEIGSVYSRLRRGHRNVILAIVDRSIHSYLNMSDAFFSGEPLYGKKKKGHRGSEQRKGGSFKSRHSTGKNRAAAKK
jgi:hypothetical protein